MFIGDHRQIELTSFLRLHTDTHILILLVFRLHSHTHTLLSLSTPYGGVVIGSRLTKRIPHTIIVLIN